MATRLTKSAVAAAVAAGRTVDLRDAGAKGLVLRVWGPGKWAWTLRRSVSGVDYRLDLGDVWGLDEARDLAGEADRLIRDGALPFELAPKGQRAPMPRWYEQRLRAKTGQAPLDTPTGPRPKPVPSLRYVDAVDEWCGELRRTRRPATVVSYRSAVTIKEFAGFLPRRVADITRADVAEVIAKIHKRAERQAETSVIAARSLYSFLARDDMVARTGVLSGSLSDLKAPERTLCEDEESDASLHVPDSCEIGRLVRALRDAGSKRSERDRLAGLLLVYSCQRRRTVAAARVADFEEIEGKGLLWSIPALHRKTASLKRRRHGGTVGSHLVPLPGPAADVVRRAMEIAGSGVTQLFPPARNRRLSQPSLHMQPETITHMFSDIESVDLSPHDVRRALGTTWAATQTASREELIGAVKEILDHAEGVVRDVTSEHYMLSRGDGRKWKTMSSWVDWVEEVSLGDGQ